MARAGASTALCMMIGTPSGSEAMALAATRISPLGGQICRTEHAGGGRLWSWRCWQTSRKRSWSCRRQSSPPRQRTLAFSWRVPGSLRKRQARPPPRRWSRWRPRGAMRLQRGRSPVLALGRDRQRKACPACLSRGLSASRTSWKHRRMRAARQLWPIQTLRRLPSRRWRRRQLPVCTTAELDLAVPQPRRSVQHRQQPQRRRGLLAGPMTMTNCRCFRLTRRRCPLRPSWLQ
mmetsp:Transcript_119752/g.298726  ORF Transcript_119752/g.298726 Transcript_119752/m.298726 type:complete len:233 (-) Transcript_119752:1663-2361(-)